MTTPTETDRLMLIGQFRNALADLYTFERYAWDPQGRLTLTGKLAGPAEEQYRAIRSRVEPLGFTPFLRRAAGGADELFALPIVLERTPQRIWLPLLLFVLTTLSVLFVGALNNGADLARAPLSIFDGLPFAATLMSILITHEFGHYIVGRWRRAPVSLPYFIPMPITMTGTMGAVIVQREPLEDRRTTLEVGIAGPLAGLLVAIPLLIYGIVLSPVGPPPVVGPETGYIQEGNSILYASIKYLVHGAWLPGGGVDVQLGQVAWGAWIGLLVTMLNLLPIGQLDGGHVAYALLGARARYLSYAVVAICTVLGVFVSNTWLIWGVLALLLGAKHPPLLNEITTPRPIHTLLGAVGLVAFILLFMPDPLRIVTGA